MCDAATPKLKTTKPSKAELNAHVQEHYRLREALSAVMWEMALVQNQLKNVGFEQLRRKCEDALAGRSE